MKLLGVYHCRDTLVGNEMMRGISGGERKRLTSAEQVTRLPVSPASSAVRCQPVGVLLSVCGAPRWMAGR